MRSIEAWQSEIDEDLRRMGESFGRAVRSPEPGGADFDALDTTLRVDQARGIISSLAGEEYWTRRGDQVCLDNQTDHGRIYLGFVVGRDPVLPAEEFLHFLVDIGQKDPHLVVPETNLARFLNLVLAEPEHQLTIWLTAAHLLATKQDSANLYAVLPGRRTDHDIYHQDVPAGAPYADKLRPEASPTYGQTMADHEARLLAEVLPTVRYTATAYAENESHLRDYIRLYLWGAVAGILAVRKSGRV